MIRNTASSWGSVSRWFHWILAALIIGMLAFGWWMNHFAARPDRFFYRSIHADIGYVVLLLMVLRLIWRGVNPTPALPADTPRWQRIAAHISHWALYAVTILVAMLGWAHSGAHTPNYAELVRVVSRCRSSPHPTRPPPDAYEDRHIFFGLCVAGADRDPLRRGALASLRQTRSRGGADGRRRAGLIDR